MRIYCNSNVFGRPFDDISQKRVFDEAIASVKIFSLSKLDFVSIVISEVLLAEVSLIEDESKKELVESLIRSVSRDSIWIDKKIIALADELVEECNVEDFMDALHIASACFASTLYFITCDDELLHNRPGMENFLKDRGHAINIRNPITFIEEVTE